MRRLRELGTGQQLLAALVVAIGVGALGVSVPVLGNAAMLLASAALLVCLAVLAQWLWTNRHATDWSHDFTPTGTSRGADSRVTGLARTVRAAGDGDADAARRVHAVVSALAAERLRDRRGLRLEADPDASRTALGPELAAYLVANPATRVTAARLDTHITTLEEL